MLHANMDALRAEEVLRERGSELTPESLREVMLLATGDEDAADEAYARRVLEVTREQP